MGQVQRRQQQDIELWELYEEEAWEAGRSDRGRNVNGSSRRMDLDRGRGDGRRVRQEREAGRSERRSRQEQEAGRGERRSRQEQEAGRSERRSRQERGGDGSARRTRNGDSIRLYEMERNEPGPGRTAARRLSDEGRRSTGSGRRTSDGGRRSAGSRRSAAGTGRRAESVSGTRHAGRSNDISEISFIGRNPQSAYRGSARPVQSIRRRRARRRKELLSKLIITLLMVSCLVMIYFITGQIYRMVHRKTEEKPLPVATEQILTDDDSETGIVPPEVIQDLLEINEYSRPGDKLSRINNIFVHYTANPGTSAAQNRSYFANLAETHERSASAHLIIGYEGELIQCIPFDEQAYAVMTRNEDSISIECCYLSEDGSFTQETYDTLIHTLSWLLDKYDLTTEDILRHYDCGGKLCPLYYAENEGAWDQLLQDVEAYLSQAKQETT